MISLRIQTLAAVATAAASLLGGAAHAGAPLCADPSSCAGSYRPVSPAYAFAPPGPAYTDAGPVYDDRAYAGHEQARRPSGFVGYDRASSGPARSDSTRSYGGDPRTWGPPAQPGPSYGGDPRTWGPAASLPPPPYAAAGYGEAAYVQGGYAEAAYSARYAEGAYGRGPGPGYGPGPAYGQPGPLPADCAEACVPAYAFAPYVPAREVISLPGESYSGGVGVTEFSGGGGGGFNGNFEVQGFGDVSAFTSSHAQAAANAVANAQSLAIAKANASASSNVNIKIKAGFFGGGKGGGGCNTCGPVKPQPKPDCGCNGVGGGKNGGWGGAPMARGGWTGGKRH